jgi:pimeloyl-[acyl-carrier protein] methyl ester esterase
MDRFGMDRFGMDRTTQDSFWAEVLAYHGWGYSAADWQNWWLWLQQQQALFKPYDRGYFGAPLQPAFKTSALAKLIFVHSYGLYFCPAEVLKEADLLVIFSSFRQFHPERPGLKKRSQQILQQMQLQFERQPQIVWQNFRAKSAQLADWSESMPGSADLRRLGQDLHQLDHSSLDLSPLQKIPRIVVFHGAQDRIVSTAMGRALADDLAASYFEIEPAGHALPFTQVSSCQAILQPMLEALRHEF